MKKISRIVVALAWLTAVLVVLVLVARHRLLEQDVEPAAAASPAIGPSASNAAGEAHPAGEADQGFLYGRITTEDGATYEGRLRFGGGEEAFWGDFFDGVKDDNPWAAHVPPERLTEPDPLEVFGVVIARRERQVDLGRPFRARFGDLARIEGRGGEVRVTLKSGTVFDLDRFDASDFDDGVRVWDRRRGVVDLDSGVEDLRSDRIRTIELLPTPALGAAPDRLHGTVRTRQGELTGFVQWDREECVGTDELDGRTADGELGVRFDTIRSIARRSPESSLVTLRDGREIVLSGTSDAGRGHRGVYVDDRRYGRVLVSWDAFERVDFTPAASGPAYGDFPPGRPLTGSVTTRAGRRHAGRLVYDLDERETTDTLDAPSGGVGYTLPFGLIASIVPPGPGGGVTRRARVTLHDGGELQLEPAGDLGEGNGGLLVFADGSEEPEHLPWTDVARIDLDRPPAMYPPLGGRQPG